MSTKELLCLWLAIITGIVFVFGCFITMTIWGENAITIDGRLIGVLLLGATMLLFAKGAGVKW